MTRDYDFFLKNLHSLYERYGPVFVAIKDEKILGIYPSLELAVEETAKKHALGTFIVQRCVENPDSLVAHFAGNIA